MPKTRINCPNCRQPIMADVEQLFDVNTDPTAKQKMLSGTFNLAQCPNCGYRGNLATPIVYHDPEKELLLTFVPPEVGLPRDEQERLIGGLINRIINGLPQEKRKGYLLRPQAHLTMQGLLERVLEGEGITKDMIQASQKRMALLQRLLQATSEDVRVEILKQENKLVDAEFFAMFTRLIESAAASGDEQAARTIASLQRSLLDNTDFGKQVKQQNEEVQAAIKSLQDVGRELTREKLLDILVEAPNDVRLNALVSLARQGMDYQFFQILSERIQGAADSDRQHLETLRGKLLELTKAFDEQLQARAAESRQALNQILQSENVVETMAANLANVDEIFLQAVNDEMEAARSAGDLEKMAKLNEVVGVLQQASAAPPGLGLIEELLDAPDDSARRKVMDDHSEEIDEELLQALSGLVAQVEQSDADPELLARLKDVNRQVRRYSMEKRMKG